MQYLKKWRGEDSRKRPAEESGDESLRLRKHARDGNGRRDSLGIATSASASAGAGASDAEYKIRGSSTTSKHLGRASSPSSPFQTQSALSPVNIITQPLPSLPSLPSPSSPSIHPDRRANIFNAALAPLQLNKDEILSPLSPSPDHIRNSDPEVQRPNPLHSASRPDLRIDILRSLTSLDPTSPDHTSVIPLLSNETARHSPSRDPRKRSTDNYRHDSNPPSRRQSDVMAPPPSTTKATRSESSTPSPPTNTELERRHFPITPPQRPLIDNLNGFAQSIMSAASLTVKRDLTKQQAVGQRKERDRQSKYSYTFLTLIEAAESQVEDVEKISLGIEKQIDISSESQSKFAIDLASQLQKAEVSDAPSSARDRARLKDGLADIAKLKAEFMAAKRETDNIRDRGRSKDDLIDLKADIKAARKEIDYLSREAVKPDELRKKLRGLATNDELRGLATRDELRGLPTQDELRRVTTDEVRKHVTEALIPTEKKLASLTVENANLNQKMKGVEGVTHKHHEKAEENDQQHSSRLDSVDTSLSEIRAELTRLNLIMQEQQQESATVRVDVGAQDKVLTDLNTYVRSNSSNADLSLNKIVTRNSDRIQLLQQDCQMLNTMVQQIQNSQTAPTIGSSPQVFGASIKANTRIEEEVKLIRSDLDDLKLEQGVHKLIRHDLDTLKVDQEKVVLIRTDLDSLVNEEKLKDAGVAEGFEAIEESLNRQHEEMVRLENDIRLFLQSPTSQNVARDPPTPPMAPSKSPGEPDQQKLHEIEIELGKLMKTTQGLELFVNCQQQKFDGLTSDRVVQSMVHQMQQMYPQHPGNLLALVNQSLARQTRVDNYLTGNLNERLGVLESRMTAREGTDPKIEDINKFAAESRIILLATTNSLKEDIKGLKDVQLITQLQDRSGHDNRIDELEDRMKTVEARYVQAIGDFQKKQTDLVRNVTHLQYRNGTSSSRNTPGELTVISRSSKSVERNGSTISFENVDDSDDSDRPISHRSDRKVRRDREEGRLSDLNLKRKAVGSSDEDGNEDGEARATRAKKVPKRRNVSGKKPFS